MTLLPCRILGYPAFGMLFGVLQILQNKKPINACNEISHYQMIKSKPIHISNRRGENYCRLGLFGNVPERNIRSV